MGDKGFAGDGEANAPLQGGVGVFIDTGLLGAGIAMRRFYVLNAAGRKAEDSRRVPL
jgi:hypothetical protein